MPKRKRGGDKQIIDTIFSASRVQSDLWEWVYVQKMYVGLYVTEMKEQKTHTPRIPFIEGQIMPYLCSVK